MCSRGHIKGYIHVYIYICSYYEYYPNVQSGGFVRKEHIVLDGVGVKAPFVGGCMWILPVTQAAWGSCIGTLPTSAEVPERSPRAFENGTFAEIWGCCSWICGMAGAPPDG